jgi:Zn-finger nucleic acid-binding protein
MKCPVCVEEMLNQELFGVEVDFCKFCAGLWLDGGEFAQFVNKGKIPIKILTNFSVDESRKVFTEGERSCPRCSNSLQIFEHKGVNLEFCYRCHGIWFDQGELKKILLNYKEEIETKQKNLKKTKTSTPKDEQNENSQTNPTTLAGVNIEEELFGKKKPDDAVKALPKQLFERKDGYNPEYTGQTILGSSTSCVCEGDSFLIDCCDVVETVSFAAVIFDFISSIACDASDIFNS